MAGGMNRRRAGRASLHERIHGTPPLSEAQAPGPRREPYPSQIRHCWVTGEHGRLPALLLEWRQNVSGWQGRVVRPVLEQGHWVIVEGWQPADHLTPGASWRTQARSCR
jgi:hypothetical protein